MSVATQTKKTVRKLVLVSIAMFGFGFALVPLYDLFCDITGINGKIDIEGSLVAYDPSSVEVDTSRTVSLRTVTVRNEQMPWSMEAQEKSLRVHPGQVYQMSYTVRNPTNKNMVAQAIPSVAPGYGAQYLRKIQCFCFDQMHLSANGEMEAHVVFYIDPEIPKDMESLVLSYTLFDVTNIVSLN